jgi:hypothetical protein
MAKIKRLQNKMSSIGIPKSEIFKVDELAEL